MKCLLGSRAGSLCHWAQRVVLHQFQQQAPVSAPLRTASCSGARAAAAAAAARLPFPRLADFKQSYLLTSSRTSLPPNRALSLLAGCGSPLDWTCRPGHSALGPHHQGVRSIHSNLRKFIQEPAQPNRGNGKKESDALPATTVIDDKNLSIWKRFKKMYREYWYVLVPVHVATSVVWFGSFYYAAKSGIDIVPWLEHMGVSETIVGPLRNSEAGYVAVAYTMYKLATPARYTVTLAGTTVSITYLKNWGVISPAPSAAQVRTMIRAKRTAFQEKMKVRRAARAKKKELRRRLKNNK